MCGGEGWKGPDHMQNSSALSTSTYIHLSDWAPAACYFQWNWTLYLCTLCTRHHHSIRCPSIRSVLVDSYTIFSQKAFAIKIHNHMRITKCYWISIWTTTHNPCGVVVVHFIRHVTHNSQQISVNVSESYVSMSNFGVQRWSWPMADGRCSRQVAVVPFTLTRANIIHI